MDVNKDYTPTDYLGGSAFGKLKMHLERYKYRRGEFKGHAPADPYKRHKKHFRVVDCGTSMAVRMYNTNILRAFPDGRIMIDLGGWETSTTKANLNYAVGRFVPFGRVSVYSRSVFGKNQMCVSVKGKLYRYYGGIELDADQNIISPLKAFEAKRIDRAESKELADKLKASGFKDMFKVLAANVTPNMRRGYYSADRMRDYLTDADYVDRWLEIIAQYTFDKISTRRGVYEWVQREPKAVWAAIMRDLKARMYEVVETDTTVIVA